jgi:hypothetical protein
METSREKGAVAIFAGIAWLATAQGLWALVTGGATPALPAAARGGPALPHAGRARPRRHGTQRVAFALRFTE